MPDEEPWRTALWALTSFLRAYKWTPETPVPADAKHPQAGRVLFTTQMHSVHRRRFRELAERAVTEIERANIPNKLLYVNLSHYLDVSRVTEASESDTVRLRFPPEALDKLAKLSPQKTKAGGFAAHVGFFPAGYQPRSPEQLEYPILDALHVLRFTGVKCRHDADWQGGFRLAGVAGPILRAWLRVLSDELSSALSRLETLGYVESKGGRLSLPFSKRTVHEQPGATGQVTTELIIEKPSGGHVKVSHTIDAHHEVILAFGGQHTGERFESNDPGALQFSVSPSGHVPYYGLTAAGIRRCEELRKSGASAELESVTTQTDEAARTPTAKPVDGGRIAETAAPASPVNVTEGKADVSRLFADFIRVIDQLIGAIDDGPAGRELNGIRPLAVRLSELARALGYVTVPLEFDSEERDGWCLDGYRTSDPWGGQTEIALLSKYRLTGAPGDSVREHVDEIYCGTAPGMRDAVLRNLRAWRRDVVARLADDRRPAPSNGEHAAGIPADTQSEAGIPPRAQKAAAQYLQAAEAMKDTNADPSDREVYDVLYRAHEQAGEANELREFSTWVRYVREWRKATGTQKKTRRAGRGRASGSLAPYESIGFENLPTSIRPRSAGHSGRGADD